jgi:hypothetical protein
VFERVLQGRLLQFLDHQKVITPGQYGFRTGHSMAMAVLNMVERVREAWRKKAFNTVDHRILLAKLDHYGVRGKALGLLGSYLRDRSQYVVYNGGNRLGVGWSVGSRRAQFWGPCSSFSMSMAW